MVIITDSPPILKAQEIVLEFILKSHPLDCPVCDQGGSCDLQNYSYQFGSNRSRFFYEKSTVKIKSWGVLINTIMTRCISCTRCTRFNLEYIENKYLGLVGRGNSSEISIFQQKLLKSIFSGNLVDLCPVGAFSSKSFK
ncbi:hypothetical protein AB834_02355 [PVC group bacterium (ex Bugula neritina AB1)]|nr:hypothetical protein AB834_02355 [PVC group bacterium (ex Bugula neritina AB1)]